MKAIIITLCVTVLIFEIILHLQTIRYEEEHARRLHAEHVAAYANGELNECTGTY